MAKADSDKTKYAEHPVSNNIEACSHYCDGKHGKLFDPARAENAGISALDTKSAKLAYTLLRKVYHALHLPWISRKRHCSNNNLGIFLTARCNLRCLNCQTSASQAPANDDLTTEQMQGIISEALALEYYWNTIYVTGGEATLHPQFFEMLDILKTYKDFNPECTILLESNGAGEKTKKILRKVPDWISVRNSSKKEDGLNSYAFLPYNIAPIDGIGHLLRPDYSRGCQIISICYGLCASMYGYYPCTPCMNVDRVYGFDIGIKRLDLVTERSLRSQMKILCQYCGHFNRQRRQPVLTAQISPAWQNAFKKYRENKTKMSRYAKPA